jgi:hypothetical protein
LQEIVDDHAAAVDFDAGRGQVERSKFALRPIATRISSPSNCRRSLARPINSAFDVPSRWACMLCQPRCKWIPSAANRAATNSRTS